MENAAKLLFRENLHDFSKLSSYYE